MNLISLGMEEKIDILDLLGRKTGVSKERMQAHKDADWHASTHVWLIDKDNNILLQKRSKLKKLFPEMWLAPVSGHIASGDDPVQTAITEAREELGLTLQENDMFLQAQVKGSFFDRNSGLSENEFINIFVTHKEFEINLDIHNDEVDGFKWFSFEEFNALVEKKDPILVPAFEEYEIIISYIKYNR